MNNAKDAAVIAAMGDKFAQFQKLALMCKEQPKTRPYVESEMTRLLESMSLEQRQALGCALADAGWGRRRKR